MRRASLMFKRKSTKSKKSSKKDSPKEDKEVAKESVETEVTEKAPRHDHPPPTPDRARSWRIDTDLMYSHVPEGDLTESQRLDFASKLGSGWKDFDAAQHALAQALEIIPATSDLESIKWLYWSDNKLSVRLREALLHLIESHGLETRDTKERGQQVKLAL